MTQALLTPQAKPRIAIMGEFSAGKSTLCNLLLRARPLPEKVTATRLAPVWMSKGPGQNHRVTLEGVEEPVNVEHLDEVPFEDTRHIRLYFEADILDHCDFIDFPGISDPNMDAEVWERVLVEADAVIWLTHATQAWRQTEAAVWETVPEAVQEKSVLLITRFDKLTQEEDRRRVEARVRKEAGPYFEEVFPISLIEALAGFDDYQLWNSSGAAAFTDHLIELISDLANRRASAQADEDASSEGSDSAEVLKVVARPVGPSDPQAAIAEEDESASVTRIVPRRVRPTGSPRRVRPGSMRAV